VLAFYHAFSDLASFHSKQTRCGMLWSLARPYLDLASEGVAATITTLNALDPNFNLGFCSMIRAPRDVPCATNLEQLRKVQTVACVRTAMGVTVWKLESLVKGFD
jgi:hypothetical protein